MCVYMRCNGDIQVYIWCLLLTVHVEVNIGHWDVFLNQVKLIVIIIINWFIQAMLLDQEITEANLTG